MKFNYLTRIRIISLFVFLIALVLVGRLYLLQIVESETYASKADRQYMSTAKNIYSRGTIFFSTKDETLVSAATLKSGFIIAINPQILKDPESVYEIVNKIIPTDKADFLKKSARLNDPYEEIATRVEPEIGQQIEDLKIPGLRAYKDRWRFYPGGDAAARIVGMLGYKGDEFAGRYGLERQYEPMLIRKDGAYVNFFAQIFSDIRSATQSDKEMEADLVTTLEPTVQAYLQDVLSKTTSKWNAQATGGIVMNPHTGEIYAMEVHPTFDPNNPQEVKNASTFSNPLVENVYEMGSIIKPLTIAAGIDAGVITSKSTYYDGGSIVVNNKTISNFDGKHRGVVDMQEALSQSLNVGMAHVVKLLGNEKFTDYMYNFGVGEKTGIDLPNEGRNLVDNLKSPRDIEHVTASFGQGIALTPITTIRALSTIANGGTLVSPHIVKSVNYKLGFSKDTPVVPGRRVIKRETSEEVTRMMVHSLDKVLQGGALMLPNYSVAIKTGTAQIARDGRYAENEFLHSFIGYFPAYKPEFIIFLYIIKPQGARYGSETLSGPFMDLTEFLINYYEVPPDRNQ